MEKIYFPYVEYTAKSQDRIREELNEIMNKRTTYGVVKSGSPQFANTEAALSWVLRGGLEYFYELDKQFLGEGNASGIPGIKADYFVNNYYRVFNAIEYLCEIWKLDLSKIKTEEDELLKDLRTLIVHSGEQVNRLLSEDFDDYKDMQLGRIFSKDDHGLQFDFIQSKYDYMIQIWADKKSKSIKKSNVERLTNEDEEYIEINMYLSYEDVKNTMLYKIDSFIHLANDKLEYLKNIEKLPEQLEKRIVEQTDFEKLTDLLRNKKRGGYTIIENEHHWDGFGLKKISDYVNSRLGIDENVKAEVNKIIKQHLKKFYDEFNNKSIDDEMLPSLCALDVFSEYTPKIKDEHYHNEKLFYLIAPKFNTSNRDVCDRVEFLAKFTYDASNALGTNINLNNPIDDVICDYFVKSVEMNLKKRRENECNSNTAIEIG